ncbi:AfsR/SARP family transcriptional regulator [Geosporobacter ferrireducens]|uniref:Bacterial transcriptional activator domain-containing protein n=1 Tax=Geosporobacter ferrireducens TaxID=1424294 RepID=A0A1D8GNR6_9FIRM|nr:BTAD domain-containing putative transcriptional regulator [Geosporobacter ferrireducens]AOT72586.1 hypothetical protein Gferi_25355 [Geosporobacter ferrireducens]MTI54986.1 hypothetical protein [Geosporobacter ferrireducens]
MYEKKLYTFGHMDIVINGQSKLGNLSSKAIVLLCYLASNKGKVLSREKLASLFWDSDNMETARYNLRYNLWMLRKALRVKDREQEIIISQKESCCFHVSQNMYVDVLDFEDLAGSVHEKDDYAYISQLEQAKKVYRGEFLEGCYIKNCPELNDWIFYERERLQRKYFDVLYQLIYYYKKLSQYTKAIDILEEMLKLNPLQEELYLEAIEIFLAKGDRNAALNQYKKCCKVLREELNIGPTESIKKVYQQIQRYNGGLNLKEKDDARDIRYDKYEIRIFYVEEQNMKNSIAKVNEHKTLKKIKTDCLPLSSMKYYWISNLIEEILNQVDEEILSEVPSWCWRDLYRIQGKILMKTGDRTVGDYLSADAEKIRISAAFNALIRILSKEIDLLFCISNFHWMDNFSYDCIKHLLFKNQIQSLRFIITGDDRDPKLVELQKYFPFQSL